VKLTNSLCPECYEVIPATITEFNSEMWMTKTCPSHGLFHTMVERSAFWWHICNELDCKNIYDGYLIDVTDRCNIKCKYCYNGNLGKDIGIDEIIKDAEKYKYLAPFVLVGGEPTVHPSLPKLYKELIQIADTVLLTNGIKLCDDEYFDELCEAGLLVGDTLNMGLSFHKESNGKDIELVEKCRERKVRIGTTLWVIDELSQIDDAISVYQKYFDVIGNMRIKAASNLGCENGADNKIFTSDIIWYLAKIGKIELITSRFNKVSFANILFNGLFIMPVSWYDVNNVDLDDISCPPYYRAKDGNLYNFVTAELINAGINKNSKNQ